jgi:hypothetical protein
LAVAPPAPVAEGEQQAVTLNEDGHPPGAELSQEQVAAYLVKQRNAGN